MPRAPRTRRAADPEASADPTALTQPNDSAEQRDTADLGTAMENGAASPTAEQGGASPTPRARAPRRRAPRKATAGEIAETVSDAQDAPDAPIVSDATMSADAAAELRLPAMADLESGGEPSGGVDAVTESAVDEMAALTAPRRRPRGGRGRGRGGVVRTEALAEESPEANDAPITLVSEPHGSAASVDAPAETSAPPPSASPSPVPTPFLSSWSSGRPFIIDEQGKVRYTDQPAPVQSASAELAPAAASFGAEPIVSPEETSSLIDAASLTGEREPEPVEREQELESDGGASDDVERESVAPERADDSTEEGARTGVQEERGAPWPARSAEGVEDDAPDDRIVERESLDVYAEVATSVTVDESALEESDPFADAGAEDEGIGADGLPRRRRRSRRGGRGRSRNGLAASGLGIEDAPIEAVLTESVLAEPFLPPEPPYEPASASGSLAALDSRMQTGGRSSSLARPAPSGNVNPLEALIARQNVILEQLVQRQTAMARSMEQALLTIDRRLAGTDLSRVSAMPRLAVFVDVPNIIYAAERYNVNVDFGKLLDFVAHDRTLIRASAYSPISDDPTQRLEFQRFVQPFVNHGYRIVTKPLKRFGDGSIKANFDIELAMDILTMSERLDIVSLVSGDGDFHRLVELVASKGVRVEVVAFAQSTAAELRAIADDYVDLTQHLKDLCAPMEYEPRPRPRGPKIEIG